MSRLSDKKNDRIAAVVVSHDGFFCNAYQSFATDSA